MTREELLRDGDPLQGLPVKLDVFEGPLDLLLHLIRESRVEIADIPVAEITRQYLEYLDLMRSLNLELAGEFLVMASTLLHIKSRLLLPADEEGNGEEAGEDPRQELVRQLIEYEKYKEAGHALGEMAEARRRIFGRSIVGPEEPRRTDYPLEVSLFDLLSAFKKLLDTAEEPPDMEISRERLTVAERITSVLEFLERAGEVPFEDLFAERRDRPFVVVTFLCILELVRLRMIRVRQAEPYGSILVGDIRPREE